MKYASIHTSPISHPQVATQLAPHNPWTAAGFSKLLREVQRQGRDYSAICPAHKGPWVSFADGKNGLVLMCMAGCPAEAIAAAVGLTLRDFLRPELAARFALSPGRHPAVPTSPERWATRRKQPRWILTRQVLKEGRVYWTGLRRL